MLLAYVDESYNDDAYWIGALVVPEDFAQALIDDLDQVVASARLTYGALPHRAELHGYDIFHAEGDWIGWKTIVRARVAVYRAALTAIASYPVEIFVRGVHRQGLLDRYINPYPPHRVVLGHLLERIDEYAEALDENLVVVADEVGEAAAYRRQLWRYQRASTDGYRDRQITQIIDTILFVPSDSSRLVQAVDLITFLFQRRYSTWGQTDQSSVAVREIWQVLTDPGRVRHTHCWYP